MSNLKINHVVSAISSTSTHSSPSILSKLFEFLKLLLPSHRAKADDLSVLKKMITEIQSDRTNLEQKIKLFAACSASVDPLSRHLFKLELPSGDYEGDTAKVKLSVGEFSVAEDHVGPGLIAPALIDFERAGGSIIGDADAKCFKDKELKKAQIILDDPEIVSSVDVQNVLKTQKRLGDLAPYPLCFDSFVENGHMEFEDVHTKDVITVLSLIRLAKVKADWDIENGEDEVSLAYFNAGREIAEDFDLAITQSTKDLLIDIADKTFQLSCMPRSSWPDDFPLPINEFIEGSCACIYNLRMIQALSGLEC